MIGRCKHYVLQHALRYATSPSCAAVERASAVAMEVRQQNPVQFCQGRANKTTPGLATPSPPSIRRGGGGGGGGVHCLFKGRCPKQNYRLPVLCYHSPLSLPLLVYSPLFSRYQKTAYRYYCCYCCCPQQTGFFSGILIQLLIIPMKTSIMANPGGFPWTSQAKNNCPHGESLLRQPPSDNT